MRLASLFAFVVCLVSCGTPEPVTVSPDSRIQAFDGRTLTPAEVDEFLNTQLADLDVPGLSLAIFNDGRVVYRRTRGIVRVGTDEPTTEASLFEAGSLTKTVFAAFVMQLVEDGVLDLDTPLHTILPFPELEDDPRYHAVTARMVLNHTTGFPNWRWLSPAPEERGIPRGTMYIKHDPGTFAYSGEAYHYLSRVVAHLTGTDMTTLGDLMNERVARPLGIEDFFWTWNEVVAQRKAVGHSGGEPTGNRWPHSVPDDDSTQVGVAGRLHTEARAYARFLIGLMDGELIGEPALDAMLSPQSRVPANSYHYEHSGIVAWGLGVAVEPTSYGTRYKHGGSNYGFQSGFALIRERRVGYVFFTNSDRGAAFNERLEAFLMEGERIMASPE